MTNQKNIQFSKDNTPNAAKLMDSLRYSGYDNNVALADLVDNSLDANATDVSVEIVADEKKDVTITIADDGIGMNEEILSQALRLGSIAGRNIESDMGRFGMGLVTASISIARRIEVYTKTEGGKLLTSIMDLDNMADTNSFDVYREFSTPEEIKLAEKFGVKNHGTLLILKKCDRVNKLDLNEFADSIRKDFGEIYRYFLRSEKKISINGKYVSIIDPMWQDGELVKEYKMKAQINSDEKYDIRLDGADKMDTVRVRVFILPAFDRAISKKLKIGIKNQGFYILRNFRQISKADDLNGLWEKHNDLNRVRVELFFSGNLDEAMGVNYTKHNIKPSQAITDKIVNEVLPEINTLRNRFKKEHLKNESSDISYSEAEKIIAQKAKLLDKADVVDRVVTDRKPRTARLTPENKEETKRRGRPSLASVARFEDHSFGVTGPIFEVEKQGKITIVQWNIDHPFYERFLVEYKDNSDLRNAVSFLVYSLGEAKLKYSNEDTYEMLENIISTISTNLRVLLS